MRRERVESERGKEKIGGGLREKKKKGINSKRNRFLSYFHGKIESTFLFHYNAAVLFSRF